MSYILDALRRADAERERGALPGLHTQAVPAGSVDSELDSRRSPWVWIVAAAFVALLGLVAWLLWGRSEPPEAAALAAATSPPAVASAPAVAPVAVVQPAALPAAAASTVAMPATVPAPAASAVAAREPSAASRKPAPAAASAPLRKPAASAPAPTAVAATTQGAKADPAAKAAEPAARIPVLSELPEEIRRGLPNITVGGSIYSKSAANRMLVINGQVFHEGDELMPALVLEQIKQKAAVLNFKGFRYEIGF